MGWTKSGLPLFLPLAGLGQSTSVSADRVETEGLELPLTCTLGRTCWVANYMDVDGTKKVRDFQCRSRSYDEHAGVDFAVRDLAVMTQGVPVVASAPALILWATSLRRSWWSASVPDRQRRRQGGIRP